MMEAEMGQLEAAKVLIIDDSPVILGWGSRILARTGFRVATHDKALGISAALERERPDLVLLDVEMPGMTGLDVVKVVEGLLAAHPVRIVLYSSVPQDELRHLALTCKAAGFLTKSADATAFINAVNAFITDSPVVPEVAGTVSAPVETSGLAPYVLFVDNDRRVLRSLERLIGRDVNSVFVDSSEAALAHIEGAQPPILVVSDILMPGLTGVDLYWRAMRQGAAWKDRFIFVTGHAEESYVQHAVKSVDVPVLQKPCDTVELRQLLSMRGVDLRG
jgi:CheY-like chemotaxis protein